MPFFLHLPGTDVLYPVTVALKAKFSVKRRLRMLVRESGLGERFWPGIAGYVGQERLQSQLLRSWNWSKPTLQNPRRGCSRSSRLPLIYPRCQVCWARSPTLKIFLLEILHCKSPPIPRVLDEEPESESAFKMCELLKALWASCCGCLAARVLI